MKIYLDYDIRLDFGQRVADVHGLSGSLKEPKVTSVPELEHINLSLKIRFDCNDTNVIRMS